MEEEQKELLKEKLKNLFDEKLNLLTNKFEADINTIETMKYSYFDNIVIPFREIGEKEKNEEAKEKEKEDKKESKKENKEKKDKEEKKEKSEEGKTFKKIKPLSLKENSNLTKTPLKSNRKRDLGFKEKTEVPSKRTTKIFEGKKNQKPENKEQNKTLPTERLKKKNVTTLDVTKKGSAAVRPSKTPINKRGRKNDDEKEAPKPKTNRATAEKNVGTKKYTGKGKIGEKKGKKEKKKVEKKEKEKEEIKEDSVKEEEKKEIILKDKIIIKIPEELKTNNSLISIYFAIKENYLTNKEKYKIITNNPTIYKSFGNDIKFLLNDKKKDIQTKINELETFLNKYGDLENYITKEFQPSKTAQNSLIFVKKEEIEKIIKSGNIPTEIIDIFKILFLIFDITFDENLEKENLLNYFITEVMDKNNVKDLKSIASNYINNHKDLNITKEKYDKINEIVSSDEKVLSSVDIAKICRNISYCTLLIRECNEFMNSKTLDEVPYYELKSKNKELQELKNKLAVLENNGKPPKKEEIQKENENENNDKVE